MMKISMLLVSLTILSSQTFAREFSCSGTNKSSTFSFSGTFGGMTKLSSTSEGTLVADGREVAHFDAGQIDVSVLRRRFKAKNDRGDEMEGKIVDMGEKIVNVTKLKIPGHGIDRKDFKVQCKTK